MREITSRTQFSCLMFGLRRGMPIVSIVCLEKLLVYVELENARTVTKSVC